MQGTNSAYQKKIKDDIEKAIGPAQKDFPHYRIISKIIPENMLPQIYKACDAFVLSSRGEGSNLCVCEASLCGLPVISTNCSGQRIYLKHDNSYLMEIDQIGPLPSGLMHLHFWDGQKMPFLTSPKCVDDLAGLMREIYENYDKACEKNRNLQKLLLENFTWRHAADAAIERLKKIKVMNRQD